MPDSHLESGGNLRELMESFLQERLAGKVEKLVPDDPKRDAKRDALAAQFELETWVEDAARRVSQLQVVTHSLKPIHPDAKGTNLYSPPESLPARSLVGSHALGEDYETDVVGNAAALDVYKFLKLEFRGKSILRYAQENDEELAFSLSRDPQKANTWMQAFAGITRPRQSETSHTLAKQLFWLADDDPTQDDHFHLLAPLYASSLAHRVFRVINNDRFGEEAKAARQAKRNNEYSESGYREYPGLAVQKLGGTKPQNISQLNSERGGANYLLASLPPAWESRKVWWPRHTESVFKGFFGRRNNVRHLVRGLSRFLESDPRHTEKTRETRDEYVGALTDELVLLAAELWQLEPGWSAEPECRLNEAEVLWLDPSRGEVDPDFSSRGVNSDWADEVCQRFGNWLNHELGKALPVADAERGHWIKLLKNNLDGLREVMHHD